MYWLVALACVVAVSGCVAAGVLSPAVPGAYLVLSLVAFAAYARDKRAAQNGRWRTSESTLHALGVIGGWPGALLAQRLLRHKSRKESFQVTFWATVIVNCAALAWVLSPAGGDALRQVLGAR